METVQVHRLLLSSEIALQGLLVGQSRLLLG